MDYNGEVEERKPVAASSSSASISSADGTTLPVTTKRLSEEEGERLQLQPPPAALQLAIQLCSAKGVIVEGYVSSRSLAQSHSFYTA